MNITEAMNLVRDEDLWETARGDLERAAGVLLAYLDRLRKTEDGVPVVPGMDYVFHRWAVDMNKNLVPLLVGTDGWAKADRPMDGGYCLYVENCQSTREAAAAAKGKT